MDGPDPWLAFAPVRLVFQACHRIPSTWILGCRIERRMGRSTTTRCLRPPCSGDEATLLEPLRLL